MFSSGENTDSWTGLPGFKFKPYDFSWVTREIFLAISFIEI